VAKNQEGQDGQEWAEHLVRRVGLAMKKARGNKSAKRLSDETAALGYRVSPTVIAKLDSGHRGSVLGVAELLVLAAALNIPPGLLLFPGFPMAPVEFLPGRTAESKAALDWFCGEGNLPTEPEPVELVPTPNNAGTEIVSLVRQFANLANSFMLMQQGYSQMRSQIGEDKSGVDRPWLERQLRETETHMAELRAQIDKLQPTFEVEEKPR
jgi:hypothetical protein